MRRFAVTLTSLDEADDVLQDSLERAWIKRSQFDPDRGSAAAWLLAIVADRACQRWRRRSREIRLTAAAEDLKGEASTLGGSAPATVDVRAAINALPRRQRQAVDRDSQSSRASDVRDRRVRTVGVVRLICRDDHSVGLGDTVGSDRIDRTTASSRRERRMVGRLMRVHLISNGLAAVADAHRPGVNPDAAGLTIRRAAGAYQCSDGLAGRDRGDLPGRMRSRRARPDIRRVARHANRCASRRPQLDQSTLLVAPCRFATTHQLPDRNATQPPDG
ncbi:MAG: RNA polymerase sigma factor [Jatrophihabitans sp.]